MEKKRNFVLCVMLIITLFVFERIWTNWLFGKLFSVNIIGTVTGLIICLGYVAYVFLAKLDVTEIVFGSIFGGVNLLFRIMADVLHLETGIDFLLCFSLNFIMIGSLICIHMFVRFVNYENSSTSYIKALNNRLIDVCNMYCGSSEDIKTALYRVKNQMRYCNVSIHRYQSSNISLYIDSLEKDILDNKEQEIIKDVERINTCIDQLERYGE